MITEIDIFGYKGKDKIEIETKSDGFLVREHRKDKETGEIKTTEKIIPKVNVEIIKELIEQNCPIGEVYTSKYVARKLIQRLGFHLIEGIDEDVFLSALWGGKYRAKYYFPYLYYPLKILSHKGHIKYSSIGQIVRCH